MPTGPQVIDSLFTVLASGGGGALIAYGIFKSYGQRWLDARFEQELELFKHERAKELSLRQVQLEGLKAATLKLLDREFEVLPAISSKLNHAWTVTNWFASPMQQYQAVGRMSPQELEEFLADTRFSDAQKDSIRSAADLRACLVAEPVFMPLLALQATSAWRLRAFV